MASQARKARRKWTHREAGFHLAFDQARAAAMPGGVAGIRMTGNPLAPVELGRYPDKPLPLHVPLSQLSAEGVAQEFEKRFAGWLVDPSEFRPLVYELAGRIRERPPTPVDCRTVARDNFTAVDRRKQLRPAQCRIVVPYRVDYPVGLAFDVFGPNRGKSDTRNGEPFIYHFAESVYRWLLERV